MGKVGNFFDSLGRVIKEKSPVLLLVGGGLTGAAAIGFAVRGTFKMSEAVDKYNSQKEYLKQGKEILDRGEEMEYTDDNGDIRPYTYDMYERDKKVNVTELVMNSVKCYWPTVIFFAASVTMFCASYNIMKKRYASATLALAVTTEAYNKYRERVRRVVGDEVEERIYLGYDDVEISRDTGLTDKKGNPIVETETQQHHTGDTSQIPPYAKFFDEANPNWDKNPEFNMLFLRRKQDQANDKLKSLMFGEPLTLNEVYSMIGIPQTEMGSQVGWNSKAEDGGDNFVDFGLYDQGSERVRRFVNGEENVVLLNFNCTPIRIPKV